MVSPAEGVGIFSDLANLGFGIYDRLQGPSDTAIGDQRFMNDFAWKQSLRNEDYQRNYMQVRSADAIAAGLHPLAALGVNVGSGPSAAAFTGVQDFSRNRGYSDMSNLGQNTQRAMLAQATSQERSIGEATVKKINAEADYYNAMSQDIRSKRNPPGQPPPLPDMNRSNKYQMVKNADGQWEWILSPEASQGIMSDPIEMWAQSLENAFAGPETRPFWRAVRRSGRRLMNPIDSMRNWRN